MARVKKNRKIAGSLLARMQKIKIKNFKVCISCPKKSKFFSSKLFFLKKV